MTFEKDRTIEMALVPQTSAPGTTTTAAPTAIGEPTKDKPTKVIIVAPPTPTDDPTKPGGTKKPNRPIDEKNPYQ